MAPDTVFVTVLDTITRIDTVIDTTWVWTPDTLLTSSVEPWYGAPAFWTGILTGSVALVSAIAAMRSARLAKQSFERAESVEDRETRRILYSQWKDLSVNRRFLWERLNYGYEIFLQEIHVQNMPHSTRPPSTIAELSLAAGVPEGMTDFPDIVTFWRELGSTCTDHSLWLWKFMSRIHSKSGTPIVLDAAIEVRPQPWNDFYDGRSAIVQTIDGWSEVFPVELVTQKLADDRALIICLAWLELSLAERIGACVWVRRRGFFKLASQLVDGAQS